MNSPAQKREVKKLFRRDGGRTSMLSIKKYKFLQKAVSVGNKLSFGQFEKEDHC